MRNPKFVLAAAMGATIALLGILSDLAPAQCVDGSCRNGSCRTVQMPVANRNTQCHPAAVRVLISDINGSTSHQTGCLVWKHSTADHALIATCAHGFTSDSRRVVVYDANGQGYEAIIKHVDHVWDVAILGIRRPPMAVFRRATRRPVVRGMIRIGGFGGGKQWIWRQGQIVGWASPPGDYPADTIETTALAGNGISGGPIVDEEGSLIGLISAGDDRSTFGPCIIRINAAIELVLHESAKPPTKNDAATPEIETSIEQGPEPPDLSGGLADLRALVEANAAAIAALAKVAAEPGPQGPRGLPGMRGIPGAPGESPAIDFATLSSEQIDALVLRLPPVVMQTIKSDDRPETVAAMKKRIAEAKPGEVIREDIGYLGGNPLRLVLVSVAKENK